MWFTGCISEPFSWKWSSPAVCKRKVVIQGATPSTSMIISGIFWECMFVYIKKKNILYIIYTSIYTHHVRPHLLSPGHARCSAKDLPRVVGRSIQTLRGCRPCGLVVRHWAGAPGHPSFLEDGWPNVEVFGGQITPWRSQAFSLTHVVG